MTGGPIAVTGALGFLGAAVARHHRAAGRDVRGVDVNADPERDVARGDIDVVRGDISRPGAWTVAFDGCDLVVHTAALVSNAAARDEAWAVNVLGTQHVLDAARDAGARRVVVFSSAAVYSHHRDGVTTEDTPVRPGDTVYGDTKIAAELAALRAHANGDVEVSILRPANVYGPGSRPWTILPVRNLRDGRVLLPAGGRGVFDPVYVDDVVAAVVAAGDVPQAAGQIFNVGGGAPVTTAEFFGRYCTMLGVDPPRTVSTRTAAGVASAVAAASRLRRRPSEITPATMRMLSGTGSLAIDRARDVLGWTPAFDLDDGMARTEAWLRAEGELDRPAAAPVR